MSEPSPIPVAIVGMACRLPQADNLEQFWQVLYEGRCTATELPPNRLDRELHYDPRKGVRCKAYTTLGCLVDYRPADPRRVPLTEDEIKYCDISHTTMAEVAAEACRHAGMDPFDMPQRLRHCGVYIGHVKGSEVGGQISYANLVEQTAQWLREVPDIDRLTGGQTDAVIRDIVAKGRRENPSRDAQGRPNLNGYMCAALISKSLKLDGPFMVVNSACASSLQALAMGVRSLQLGHVDMAIVGGASYCKFDSLVMFSQAQSVSATGTRPFDADADGLINGEGYIAMIAKRLDRALADGDRIHAVVRSIGISSDGRGKSLWAPKMEGQVEAMSRAYGRGLDVTRLQYVEAHATSTQVGDQTEVASLAATLNGRLPPGRKIPIGSVKGNVGHTIETAGMAGVLKTILAMQHGIIPPAVNVKKLNPEIDWDNVPLYVPLQPEPWPAPADGHPRRAACNSFGIGGLNVHVVLDQTPTPDELRKFQGQPAPALVDETKSQPPLDAIAIIGVGAILPGANTIQAFHDLLDSGRDGTVDLPPTRWNAAIAHKPAGREPFSVPSIRGGFVTGYEYDWKKHKVPPKQVHAADPLQFMLLDAVDQAFQMSGYDKKPFDRKRTGVYVGAITSGEFHEHLQMGLRLPEFQRDLRIVLRDRGVPAEQIEQAAEGYVAALLSHMPAITDETGSYTSNTLVSRITKQHDLMGGGAAIDAGGSSGSAALATCIDLLQAGDFDMMVCTAGQRSMGFSAFQWFHLTGQLATEPPKNPFDAQARGLVPGEGTGVFLLKRLSDAQRDGDNVIGIIRGVGVGRDESFGNAMERAVRRGLDRAGVQPADVAYVESAALGLPTDRQEFEALARVYGAGRTNPLYVGTLTQQIGYIGSASLMAAMSKALHSLDRVEAAPNLHLDQPADYVAAQAGTLTVPTKATPIPTTADGRLFAGVSTSCSDQLAYHFLVERGTPVPENRRVVSPATVAAPAPRVAPAKVTPPPRAVAVPSVPAASSSTVRAAREASSPAADFGAFRILRVTAADTSALAMKLQTLAANPAEAFEQAAASRFDGDAWRVAIVAESSDELLQRLTLAAQLLPRPDSKTALEEKGIYVGPTPASRPRIALLFPGHGSQYDEMLKSLVADFAPAADALRSIDAILTALHFPTFAQVAWSGGDHLGRDVWLTQLALLVADTIVHAALRAIGVVPDRVAGHSFGEFPALIASGAWTFEAAVRATHARCSAIEACPSARGIMMSVGVTAEALAGFLGGLEGKITISVRNAPDQLVVGGDEASVHELERRLKEKQLFTRVLPAPRPFHTPLMASVKAPFGAAIQEIPLQPPTTPLLSSVTNRYVADPEDIRHNLVEQMTDPVHYDALVTRLANDGVSAFVEAGPHQVLTKLHRRILEGRTVDGRAVTCIGGDQPKRNGLRQLVNVRACLEVAGAFEAGSEESLFGRVTKLNGKHVDVARVSKSDAERAVSADSVTRRFEVPPRQPARAEAPRVEPAKLEPTPAATAPAAPLSPARRPAIDAELARQLNVLSMSGTPYDMGFRHGQTHGDQIRRVLHRYADLAGSRWQRLPNIDEATGEAGIYFGPDEMEELQGVADGAGVMLESVVAHNLYLYPDLGSACSYFAVSRAANGPAGLVHGTNEDQPLSLSVRDCLRRNVQVRFPKDGVPHVLFGIVGQLGGINGMNAHGLAISSAMLLDCPRRPETAHGRAQSVLVKRILESAADIDTAIDIARSNCGAGGWSMCLSRRDSDDLVYVEYDGKTLHCDRRQKRVVAANHSRLLDAVIKAPTHSLHRLARLTSLFGGDDRQPITLERAQAALRDRFDVARGRETAHPTMNTIRRVDNQVSIVLLPQQNQAWIADATRPEGQPDQWFSLDLGRLLGSEPGTPARHASEPGTLARRASEGISAEPACTATLLSGEVAVSALANGGVGPEKTDAVCYRYQLALVETVVPESPSNGSPKLNGPALILGSNDVARALRDRIVAAGRAATILESTGDLDAAVAAVDAAWQAGPAPHLFVTTPFDAAATTALDPSAWLGRRQFGANVPFFVAQRWTQLLLDANLLDQASIVAATQLGGDFGLSGAVRGAESGALTGLVKSLHIELGLKTTLWFLAKVVDSPAHEPADVVAANLLREAGVRDREVEVGYRGGRRFVPRPVATRAPHASLPAEKLAGGTWVITGGARGVTAVVARELGRRFGATLHLIGSSPLPQIDPAWRNLDLEQTKTLRQQVMKDAVAKKEVPANAWSRVEKAIEIDRNLRALTEAGVSFTYHVCDITDRAKLGATLAAIRQSGPIRGVVHGAGFEAALRFEKKKRDSVERTLAVKCDGAAALMEQTAGDPLEFFLAFGSVSGRFGGIGQADYATANDLLAKLVDWYRTQRPEVRATTFHWHAWDEVGMAVRPESSHLRDVGHIKYMPTREGTAHLIDEVLAGVPEREIVITGWPFHKLNPEYATKLTGGTAAKKDPPPYAPAQAIVAPQPLAPPMPAPVELPPSRRLPDADPTHRATGASEARPSRTPVSARDSGGVATLEAPAAVALAESAFPNLDHLPLIDGLVELIPGTRVITETQLDPTNDPFLAHHLFKGRPLMPAVAIMATVAQAASLLGAGRRPVVAIRNVELLEPLKFHTDRPETAHVRGVMDGDLVHCELTCDFHARTGKLVQADRLYQRATIELADAPLGLRARPAPALPESAWRKFNYREDIVLWHGPVFRCLKQVAMRGPHGWGRMVAQSPGSFGGTRLGDTWLVAAAAIDAAFYTCGVHVREHIANVAKIPKSIDRVLLGRLPRAEEKLLTWATCNELDNDHGIYDFTIYGEDGGVICRVEGYHGVFVPRGGDN